MNCRLIGTPGVKCTSATPTRALDVTPHTLREGQWNSHSESASANSEAMSAAADGHSARRV